MIFQQLYEIFIEDEDETGNEKEIKISCETFIFLLQFLLLLMFFCDVFLVSQTPRDLTRLEDF